MANRRRSKGFHMYMTEKEFEVVRAGAEADGLSLAALVRRAALRESARLIRNAGRGGGG